LIRSACRGEKRVGDNRFAPARSRFRKIYNSVEKFTDRVAVMRQNIEHFHSAFGYDDTGMICAHLAKDEPETVPFFPAAR
jgi:hypothetical protein